MGELRGPGWYAGTAWLALALPGALIGHHLTHRWEERQTITETLPYSYAGLLIVVLATAARSRPAGPLRAIPWALVIGVITFGLSSALYRWVIPLPGDAAHLSPWLLAALPAAAIGYGASRGRNRTPGYTAGAVIAVAGALFAPVTARLAAEAATRSTTFGSTWFHPGETVTAQGDEALYAVGAPPDRLRCEGPIHPLHLSPGSYSDGSDAYSFDWIARVGPGPLTCADDGTDPTFALGPIPDVGGLAGEPLRWPVPFTRIAGALPGLLILAAARRRNYFTIGNQNDHSAR